MGGAAAGGEEPTARAPFPRPLSREWAGFIEVLKCLECHTAPASRTAVCLLGPARRAEPAAAPESSKF